uniref:Uncharacterized protein LOC100366770 n=1 Tax=Saccoglossus kowalevskii TaxID=10224 RepID=A0ABM0ML16_SACKO|nr:PREDICTED: uncharacterized protein LOC100366770 [Saccoglossus kowalevskii]
MSSARKRPKLQRGLSGVKRQFSWRQPVRPFISSTFKDFAEERDYLVRKVFPQIDNLCRQRGTYFAPVDLRWGINDEQSNSGNVVTLCLDYINRCTPFFICLLGERYGSHRPIDAPPLQRNCTDIPDDSSWLDKNFLVAASNGYSWVLQESHQTCSVTELEIIQAAFLNDNAHCHFYFRESVHIDNLFTDLPEEEREILLEKYHAESDYAELKMRDLKKRIVTKGLPVKYFQTPQELGRLVLEDWTGIINKMYPDINELILGMGGEQFQEWMAHEAFAETRRRVFVSTPDIQALYAKLDEFAESLLDESHEDITDTTITTQDHYTIPGKLKEPSPAKYKSVFVVTGDRGCGKTSILSNWVKEFRDNNRDIKVLTHYVGASSISTDVTSFMRRATYELREEYIGEQRDSNSSDAQDLSDFHRISEAFIAALGLGPCVLILDGIDELSTTFGVSVQQVKEMSWLSATLPPQCKIILTTVKSDLSFRGLAMRKDAIFHSVSLITDPDIRCSIVEEHLAVHCKSLDKEQINMILECKLSERPLFLCVLANELRVCGTHRNLNKQLQIYLESANIRDLWRLIIERWIKDYGWTTDHPYSTSTATFSSSTTPPPVALQGWVADALRLIAVSRNGLTEKEILDILEIIGYSGPAAVTSFDWALFRSAALDSLMERPGGIVGKSTRPTTNPGLPQFWERQKQLYHSYIGRYLMKQEHNQRRVEELPWQLEMSGELAALSQILSEPRTFSAMCGGEDDTLKLDLHRYWKTLRDAGFDPSTIYKNMIEKASQNEAITDRTDSHIEIIFDNDQSSEKTQSVSVDDVSEKGDSHKSDCQKPELKKQLSVIEEISSSDNLLVNPSDISIPVLDEDRIDKIDDLFLSSASDGDIFDATSATKESDISQWCINSVDHESDSSREEDFYDAQENVNSEINAGLSKWSSAEEYLTAEDEVAEQPPISKRELASLSRYAGQFLSELGHFDRARELLFMAYTYIKEKTPLSSDELLIRFKIEESLAEWHFYQLKNDEAENFYKKSLNTLLDIPEEDCVTEYNTHMESKGRLLNRLGNIKIYSGNWSEAQAYLQEAKECMNSAKSTAGRATVYYNLGVYWLRKHRHEKAEPNLRQALSLRERWYGTSHPLVAEVLDNLATLLSDRWNHIHFDRAEAEPMFRRALQIRETSLGPNHLLFATTLFHLGRMLKDDGSRQCKKEAIQLLKRSLDVRSTILGPNHKLTKAVRMCLKQVESQLAHGEYDYAPVKQPDKRTPEQPYSSMSWHDQDLIKLDKRPSPRFSQRPLSRGEINRGSSSSSSVGRRSHRSQVTSSNSFRLDDGGNYPSRSESKQSGYDSRPVSQGRSSNYNQWQEVRYKQRSQRSGSGSTVHSGYSNRPVSAMDADSVHRVKCTIPGKFTIDSSNAKNVIHGPHIQIQSLLGEPPCPRPLTGLVHTSSWYHVPGRYSRPGQYYPPKRHQMRPNNNYQQSSKKKNREEIITADVKKLTGMSSRKTTQEESNEPRIEMNGNSVINNDKLTASISKITFKEDVEINQ